jgi:DNA-binding NtrC family response regulator
MQGLLSVFLPSVSKLWADQDGRGFLLVWWMRQMTERELSQDAMNGEVPSFAEASKASGRLLVIDDDAAICMLIEKLGEKAGFAATRAISVEEATRLLHAHRFDCITLDLSLGKNTGIELLKVLSEMACTTPIIIISGAMRSMRDFAASIGNMMHLPLQAALPKPIDFAKLKAALAEVKRNLDSQRKTTSAA